MKNTIILQYDFGREDQELFDYTAYVNYADYLAPYLQENYSTVKGAVEDLYKDGLLDEIEKKEALKCKNLKELADFIDDDTAETLVESDDDFIENFIVEDLKEKNYDEAYEAYQEAISCDPDGFYGWDDYYSWKND